MIVRNQFGLQYNIQYFYLPMQPRYKLESYHMMESFNKTGRPYQTTKQYQPVYKTIGSTGSTWDAKHMTNFLNQTLYPNQQNSTFRNTFHSASRPKANSTNDYFFKTTKDNKNASKIGFSPINPLITNISVKKHSPQKITQILSSKNLDHQPQLVQQGNFKFTSNKIKFQKTNPINLEHIGKKESTGFDKQRMMRLIHKRHPHGILSVDHPQNPQSKYYENFKQTMKIRKEPNSHRTHVIDCNWKVKRAKYNMQEDDIYGFKKPKLALGRRFSNDNVHGYNIINNLLME